MNWSDERYVRLFCRNTPEWVALTWQARAVFALLLREVDRSGVLATKLASRGVSGIVQMPIEVVDVGLADLLRDGCVQVCIDPPGYVIPNFMAAQEAAYSGKARSRKWREARRDRAVQNTSPRDDASRQHNEMSPARDETSPSVTRPVQYGVVQHSSGSDPDQGLELDLVPSAAKKAAKRLGKAELPAGWIPKPEHISRATKLDLNLDRAAQRFRLWAAETGKKMADWDSRFDRWLLDDAERQQSRGGARIAPHTVGRAEPATQEQHAADAAKGATPWE